MKFSHVLILDKMKFKLILNTRQFCKILDPKNLTLHSNLLKNQFAKLPELFQTTTDWTLGGKGCTRSFSGTSASAPLAAGIYGNHLKISSIAKFIIH